MKWFKNFRTVSKLVFAFLLVSCFMLFVGYEGISSASDLHEMTDVLYQRHLLGISAIKQANINLVKIGRGARTLLSANEKSEIERVSSDTLALFAGVNEELNKASKTLQSVEDQERMKRIQDLTPKYEAGIREIVRLAQNNDIKGARSAAENAAPLRNEIDRNIDAISDHKEALGKETFVASTENYNRLRRTFIGVISFAVVFSMAFGWLIARLIARPLEDAVRVLGKVQEGDLTVALDVDTTDEIGQMAKSLNAATKAMRDALAEVRSAAEGMADSSQELAAASEELSSGAQEQASSLEETTATMEQITSTVKQNSDNASQANQFASASRENAERGGQVVSDAVAAMTEINKCSASIAEIITTIDEIAFQTNLLALNAAVEAARAGEQGRGFAVVAGEVRNLAQRSATSAKEIKRLIQDSVQKIDAGSALVNKSGDTLTEIVGSVKKVTDIVGEIAAASREQSTGIEQVNKAMLQMDQVTQTNASQTEELSSTAQSLSTQAQDLQTLVGRFRLESEGSRQAKTSAAAVTAATPESALRVTSAGAPIGRKARQRSLAPVAAGSVSAANALNWNNKQPVDESAFAEF